MRVVIDSNVVVAAFATQGFCHSLFELCLKEHALLVSENLLAEIQERLLHRICVPASTVKEIISLLRANGHSVEPEPLPSSVTCRDPDDLKILALAISGQAQCLVTGDADLLVLEKVEGIPILSPRQFYQLLRQP